MLLVGDNHLVARVPVDAVCHGADAFRYSPEQGNLAGVHTKQVGGNLPCALEPITHRPSDRRDVGPVLGNVLICADDVLSDRIGQRPGASGVHLDGLVEGMDFGADGINVELWQLFSRVAHEAAIEGFAPYYTRRNKACVKFLEFTFRCRPCALRFRRTRNNRCRRGRRCERRVLGVEALDGDGHRTALVVGAELLPHLLAEVR